MRATPLAGPILGAALSDLLFTEVVDVLENAPTEDSIGYEAPDWTVAAGLSDLSAAVGSDSLSVDQLQPGSTLVRSITSLKFVLATYHPEITTANRLRWQGEDWRIVSRFPDMTTTLTHLSCERMVPGV